MRSQPDPSKSTPRRSAPSRPAKAEVSPAPAPEPPAENPQAETPQAENPRAENPRAENPPAKKATRARTQPAAKAQPPRVEATTPLAPAKAQPAKAQPAAKAQPPVKAPPAKAQPSAKTQPAKAQPARAPRAKAQPAKTSPPAKAAAAVPAEAAAPVKRAAEVVVAPDLTTVAEVQPTAVTPTPVPEVLDTAVTPGQPGAAVPAEPTLPRPTASVTDVLSGARTEAWAALIADPGHSPELLAVAATQTIGPRAREWARRTRAAYPAAAPEALARLAVSQFTRFGSVSSIFAAVAGSYAPLALLGAAAFTHAEIALHVAAAYGLDPTDRARAAELLVLTRVHPGRADAEAALAAAGEHSYESTGLTDATWRLGRMLAAQAGGWAAVRLVNRFFPGTALLAATLTSRGAARAMAARATLFYRDQSQVSQRSGSSV